MPKGEENREEFAPGSLNMPRRSNEESKKSWQSVSKGSVHGVLHEDPNTRPASPNLKSPAVGAAEAVLALACPDRCLVVGQWHPNYQSPARVCQRSCPSRAPAPLRLLQPLLEPSCQDQGRKGQCRVEAARVVGRGLERGLSGEVPSQCPEALAQRLFRPCPVLVPGSWD